MTASILVPRKPIVMMWNCFLIVWLGFGYHLSFAQQPALIANWPLNHNLACVNDSDLSLQGESIDFGNVDGKQCVRLNGVTSRVLLVPHPKMSLGKGPFSVAMWIHTNGDPSGLVGDLVSQYSPELRAGFQVSIADHLGVTTGQPNRRQLHFGIDQALQEEDFEDHGRLGNAVFIFSMCVYRGNLYASTCCTDGKESGHVYRWKEGRQWEDLGSPDRANSISAMAVYNDRLYVASSKYRLAGSSLQESDNPHFGGKVYALNDRDGWDYCGTLSPETEAVSSLVVFRGKLYASSLYKPAGFFRYEGGLSWTACSTPGGKRTESLTVYQDAIYASCYDEGAVFRFDGTDWTLAGTIPGATQTYGFGIYQGKLHVSEWPQAHVFRYEGENHWNDTGRLGSELEAMPLLTYNGKLYGGTLPNAQIFRFDGDNRWTQIGQVDKTPDVKYRRAWSMCVYRGRLFVGTLPSGRVLSIECGKNATWDEAMPDGWHHIGAVRGAHALKLFVDGKEVASSSKIDSGTFVWNDSLSLEIGSGASRRFTGAMRDLHIYRGELSIEQIRSLANAN